MKHVKVPEECYIKNEHEQVVGLRTLQVVDWLLDIRPCVTMLETDHIMIYDHGIYKKHGEKILNAELERIFGRLTRPNKSELILKTTGGIMKKIRHRTYTRPEAFDNNADLINMKNGLFNWRTGEFSKHDPDYPCLIQIPVKYDPEAKCPKIETSFKSVFHEKDLIKWLEFISYCLYNGYPIQKAIILYSEGENGKSFAMNIVRAFLGSSNCAEVSLHELSADKFAGSDLYGKLMNACGDLDDTMLKVTGNFKKAISGLDPMRAQEKGEKAFDFINRAKMVFGTNIFPASKDSTIGFFRKLEPITTDKLKKGDAKRLGLPNEQEVTTEEELSGLFNWVIPLLAPLISRGKFTNQQSLEDVTEIYTSASDPIMTFASTQLIECPGVKLDKQAVFDAFKEYCKDHNVYQQINNIVFWNKLHKLIPDLRTQPGRINKKNMQCMYDYNLKRGGYETL